MTATARPGAARARGPRGKLFGYFDRAYVINLDSRPERLARVARHLEELSIPFERFPGVVVKERAGHESAGFHGCALAHMGVWRRALDEGLRRVLIFEDDVALRADVHEQMAPVVAQLRETPWDILYLGVSLFRHSRYSKRVAPNLREFEMGADLHAYAMHRRSLERALQAATDMLSSPRKVMIDLLLSWSRPPFVKLHTMPMLAVMLPDYSDNLGAYMNRLWEYFVRFPRREFVRRCPELRRALQEAGVTDMESMFRVPAGYGYGEPTPRRRRRKS